MTSPTTATVSIKESAWLQVLILWLSRGARTILLIGLVTIPCFGQDSPPAKVTFHVSPAYTRVFVIDGESSQEYPPNQEVHISPSSQAQNGSRELILRYYVPKWGTDTEPDDEVFVDFRELHKFRRFPRDGTHQVKLTTLQSFSAFTKNRPLAALASLAALLGVVAGLLVLRTRLRAPGVEQVVPGYTLNMKIGQGGMGEVWSATSDTGQRCATKFLLREFATDPDYKARFEREIKACLPLKHPHLVRLYGYGETTDGRLYTVSELLEGQTLKEAIKDGLDDPPQVAARLVEQIGDVLQYLHDNGLVHRDIKPDNIFLCSDGTFKLLDTGLLHGADVTVLTRTGQILGTPAYLPPEQARNESTAASDQYSLGIVLYEILAGERPFRQTELAMLAYQHRHSAPQPPSEVEPRIPKPVEDVVLRMLEKEPAQRFASISEVQQALEESLSFLTWR